jgi:hypothetical protein
VGSSASLWTSHVGMIYEIAVWMHHSERKTGITRIAQGWRAREWKRK